MQTAILGVCLTAWMLVFGVVMSYMDMIYYNMGREIDEGEREQVNRERRWVYFGVGGFLAVLAVVSLVV